MGNTGVIHISLSDNMSYVIMVYNVIVKKKNVLVFKFILLCA